MEEEYGNKEGMGYMWESISKFRIREGCKSMRRGGGGNATTRVEVERRRLCDTSMYGVIPVVGVVGFILTCIEKGIWNRKVEDIITTLGV